jgi:L-threonylcarbamoyladenylate synthase
VPEKAKQLAATFCPGPLTFLLPKKPVVPDIVTAGSDYVAIRIPAHPLTLELLRQIDFPLAAPSANPFGYVSPTTAQHVMEHLQGKIPYILDGGECSIGVESTIIQFNEQDQIIVNRVGGVAVEGIEKITGEKVILHTTTENQPAAPGQLKSHYATHTPLVVGSIDLLLDLYKDKKVIIISFTRSYTHPALQKQYVLSPAGHMEEAAQKLFKTLRAADTLEADVILAEHFPDEGLGRAINDRLHRAQHIYK